MGTNTQLHKAQRHIAQLMRRHDSHVRYLVAFVFAAILVAFGVEIILSVDGIAATHTEQVLDCHFSGDAAHTHDESCYDAAGNLVCPLLERSLHTHTDDCYMEERKLVCGLEEGPDHEHTDACYEVTRTLTCGQEELTTEHVHGPGCFETITVDDGDDAADETDATDGVPSAPDAPTDTPAATDAGQDAGESQAAAEQGGSETDETVKAIAQHFSKKVKDQDGKTILKVDVDAPEGALPAGATMTATWVDADDMTAKQQKAVDQAVSKETDGAIVKQQAVDLTFYDAEGNKVEPTDKLTVTFASGLIDTKDQAVVVHMDDLTEREMKQQSRALKQGKSAEEAEPTRHAQAIEPLGDKALARRDMSLSDNELAFESDQFSTYVIAVTTLRKVLTASNGVSYTVTVDAPAAAGVSQDDELAVREILAGQDTEAYDAYAAQAQDALGQTDGSVPSVRLFDIKVVNAQGEKVTIAAPVAVSVDLTDAREDAHLQVVHFADEASNPDVVADVAVDGTTVSFEADGFSVYAIVEEDQEPATVEVRTVANLAELAESTSEAFYLSVSGRGYFTNTLNSDSAFLCTPGTTTASTWAFESAGEGNRYYLTTTVDGQKKYVKNTSDNYVGLGDSKTDGTIFELSEASAGTFYVKVQGSSKWLQYSNGGKGIRLWGDKNDPVNPRITLTYASSTVLPPDPYNLDGRHFGIAYHDESVTSVALMAEPINNETRLAATDMLMKPDVRDNDGILLVAEDSDITEWTFRCIEGDKYYLTTTANGHTKYLTINGTNVTLEDEPHETNSVITATPGTDANAGKWHLSVGTRSLNFTGNTNNGFNAATGSGDKTWLNLVELTNLNEDEDFVRYTAKKVSVSDEEEVHTDQKVVIYTRVWNDTTKRYDFYAVDHDGSLIRCYDIGDGIEWIGSDVNTALWDFTEYLENGVPSHYYELENVQYSGTYIAPQVTGDKVFSPKTFGINLNGRRYGRDYTTIIAWDEKEYSYSGLKVENGRVVPCALSEAQDFYFAVMDVSEDPNSDKPGTVATVDSNAYGITMKMINFNNGNINNATSPRDSVQTPFFGVKDNNQPGLLSTNLGSNGYPTTTSLTNTDTATNEDHFLSDLFTNMTPVNHLFIESIYNESGYFEYSSTSNFAHLNDNGTFTVYDKLGAIGDYKGQAGTGEHGQFMPYDDIVDAEGNPKAYCDFTNRTEVTGTELPDTDARKGEQMYNIGTRKEVDYHFGMEMSANFTQTADGLDAWGHDIIFEFSGDDDFWFYVDGELVLDLGGVHSAMEGSINFRTGEVKSSRGNSTLYEIFASNYRTRDMSEDQITAKLAEIFVEKVVDGETVHVFADYSNHEMKMFYMERGAGASNLHMRFNLAAVKPGTFLLSKKLSGTDSSSNPLIEFPYQVWYTTQADGETQWHLLDEKSGEGEDATYNVTYEGSSTHVRFAQSYTPSGGTDAYENVFFLKPGETAQVALPDNVVDYYVVECGVNPGVYDAVKANSEVLSGTDLTSLKNSEESADQANYRASAGYTTTNNTVSGTPRCDYKTSAAPLNGDSPNKRSKVDFDNHVKEGADRTLSITKRLYDSEGNNRIAYPNDTTVFKFRLYLGNEGTSADDLPEADNYSYYVKDSGGNYCRWDSEEETFVSLSITDFGHLKEYLDSLSAAQRDKIVFTTSSHGAIDKIPIDHTVEVRDLIVDTVYKVEERDYEIPKGYTLRLEDGYTRVDDGRDDKKGTIPYTGTIAVDEDPEIEVRNQVGWGLTVKKVWSDADFMASHDPIYFAVYAQGNTNPNEHANDHAFHYELVDGSVRQLVSPATSLYYFFDSLKADTPFSAYVVFEVTLTGSYTVDKDGVVTLGDGASVERILEGRTLTNGGTPVGGEHRDGYSYTVTYQPGEQTTLNAEVREDTVTNSRPGIKLYKTDWTGSKLAGATFTLKDATTGKDVAAESYTSRESDGLVTIVYVSEGTYTLTETATPGGYVALPGSLSITVDGDGGVAVSGGNVVSQYFYSVDPASGSKMATIYIKNRTVALEAKKTDDDGEPLAGAHFALYQQVVGSDGKLRRDYDPLTGFENLETGEDGIIPHITMDDIPRGRTYYLSETQAPGEYDLLDGDVCFTIGNNGTVVVDASKSVAGASKWLSQNQDSSSSGKLTYTITIPNGKMKQVQLKKVDVGNSTVTLVGAGFSLYRASDFDDATNRPKASAAPVASGTTGQDGILALGQLARGEYRLVETTAPDGYLMLDTPVKLTVEDNGVTALQADNQSKVNQIVDEDTDVITYEIVVWNTAGVELPNAGGVGTGLFSLAGALLVASGALVLACRRGFAR